MWFLYPYGLLSAGSSNNKVWKNSRNLNIFWSDCLYIAGSRVLSAVFSLSLTATLLQFLLEHHRGLLMTTASSEFNGKSRPSIGIFRARHVEVVGPRVDWILGKGMFDQEMDGWNLKRYSTDLVLHFKYSQGTDLKNKWSLINLQRQVIWLLLLHESNSKNTGSHDMMKNQYYLSLNLICLLKSHLFYTLHIQFVKQAYCLSYVQVEMISSSYIYLWTARSRATGQWQETLYNCWQTQQYSSNFHYVTDS